MDAMLFAAGMGKRLKPLTDTTPKALIRVAGKALIDHILERLQDAGARRVVINVHHYAGQIIAHLQHHSYSLDIVFSNEQPELLDTGGGLRHAAHYFPGGREAHPILLHNVDILSNADLAAFYAAHTASKAALLVSERIATRYLLFDDELQLRGWINATTGEIRSPYAHLDLDRLHRYAFSGIHTFSPSLFPLMERFPRKFSITEFYLSVCDRVPILAHPCNGLKVLDVGKVEAIAQAETFLQTLGYKQL